MHANRAQIKSGVVDPGPAEPLGGLVFVFAIKPNQQSKGWVKNSPKVKNQKVKGRGTKSERKSNLKINQIIITTWKAQANQQNQKANSESKKGISRVYKWSLAWTRIGTGSLVKIWQSLNQNTRLTNTEEDNRQCGSGARGKQQTGERTDIMSRVHLEARKTGLTQIT